MPTKRLRAFLAAFPRGSASSASSPTFAVVRVSARPCSAAVCRSFCLSVVRSVDRGTPAEGATYIHFDESSARAL